MNVGRRRFENDQRAHLAVLRNALHSVKTDYQLKCLKRGHVSGGATCIAVMVRSELRDGLGVFEPKKCMYNAQS